MFYVVRIVLHNPANLLLSDSCSGAFLPSKIGTIRVAIAAIDEMLPVSRVTSPLCLVEGIPATFAGFKIGLDLKAHGFLGATCRIEFHFKPPFVILD